MLSQAHYFCLLFRQRLTRQARLALNSQSSCLTSPLLDSRHTCLQVNNSKDLPENEACEQSVGTHLLDSVEKPCYSCQHCLCSLSLKKERKRETEKKGKPL